MQKKISHLLDKAIANLRSKEKDTPETMQSLSVGGGIDKSNVIIGNNNQITLLMNGYIKTRPMINEDELSAQLDEYMSWMRESYGSITLRGIEEGGRQVVALPLESVYVPLQAEFNTIDDPFAPSGHNITQKIEQHQESIRINLNEILAVGTRLIITGSPGCGKTTVLQHIAWTLAVGLQGQPALANQKLGLSGQLPLPIYVPLSLYALHLRNLPVSAKAEEKSLATFITEYLIQRQTSLNLPPDFLSHLLRDAKTVLLLLDGLDEVPNENERIHVRQAIEDLLGGRTSLRVLVTSRTAAYRGEAVLGRGFQHIRVLALETTQVKKMVSHAYDAIHPNSKPKAKKQTDDLLRDIAQLEADRRKRLGDDVELFVNSPLMIRLLLIVHFNNRALPDQRADLYQKTIDAMLRPDYALDQQVTSEIERRVAGGLATNRDMLQMLAYHMHSRGEKQGREIDENTLKKTLCENYAPSVVDELLAQTRERGTLLEERGGMYRFIHLSFQEFLAGRYLAKIVHDPEKIAEMLESGLVLDSWWREPILLMIGYLDVDSPTQVTPLLLRMAEADTGFEKRTAPQFQTQLACAELATAAMLECRNQYSKIAGALKERLKTLYQQSPNESWAPTTLASAMGFLDRFGYQPDDLYSFVKIEIGKSNDEIRSQKDGDFILFARYPVTNAQYARFLTQENFANKDLWTSFPKYDENSAEMMGQNWGEEPWDWLQKKIHDPLIQDESVENGILLPRYWHGTRFGQIRPGAPVVGISWCEANAYCKWLSQQADSPEAKALNTFMPQLANSVFRLPTELEWVRAAGGGFNNRFAFGSLPDEKAIIHFANTAESSIHQTTPVWMYPQGASDPYNIYDLSGNVWEWQINYRDGDFDVLSLRGGSWDYDLGDARIALKDHADPYGRYGSIGFRVVFIPSD